ncbi:MAG: MarR family transcriptional regulator [Actinobacteria bacterium]|nr:MarR family transcriptional regulator [Actinomycetota bacterium]
MSAHDDLEVIERALAELMRLASSRRVHDSRMRAVGLMLSRTETRFLARIDELGPRSVTALADELDVSQPTASRALRRLEDLGLVQRRSDEADGRVAIYDVSARGRRERERLQDLMRTQLSDALAGLPPNRRHDLAVLMEDLAGRIRRQGVADRTMADGRTAS